MLRHQSQEARRRAPQVVNDVRVIASQWARILVVLVGLAGFGALAEESRAQEEPGSSTALPEVVVESLEITPAELEPDTLYQLKVVLHNGGSEVASAFAFRVSLDGQPLRVYDRQLFYQLLPAGEKAALQLFNFWSNETGRHYPADGALDLEVELLEAQWMKVERQEVDGKLEEVWKPLGEVAGLPSNLATSLKAGS